MARISGLTDADMLNQVAHKFQNWFRARRDYDAADQARDVDEIVAQGERMKYLAQQAVDALNLLRYADLETSDSVDDELIITIRVRMSLAKTKTTVEVTGDEKVHSQFQKLVNEVLAGQ